MDADEDEDEGHDAGVEDVDNQEQTGMVEEEKWLCIVKMMIMMIVMMMKLMVSITVRVTALEMKMLLIDWLNLIAPLWDHASPLF